MKSRLIPRTRKEAAKAHGKKRVIPFVPVRRANHCKANVNQASVMPTGKHHGRKNGYPSAAAAQLDVLNAVWQNTTTGFLVYDLHGRVLLANPAAGKMARRPPEGSTAAESSKVWGHMFNGAHRVVAPGEWPSMLALKGLRTEDEQFRFVRERGNEADLLFSAFPLNIPAQPMIGAIATLTNVSAPARQALDSTHNAVWAERRRMAADLHDLLCQDLQAIVLQLRVADEQSAISPDAAWQYVRRAHDLAREVLAEARRTMWSFTHEAVNTRDPAIALAKRARQLFAGTPVKLTLSLQEEPKSILGHLRSELFRIGKEALTNVRKHANASMVHMELAYSPTQVQLAVEDNGRGFARSYWPTSKHGFGLVSMRKRAERMGGQLHINAQLNRGTKITAVLPLRSNVRHMCADSISSSLSA